MAVSFGYNTKGLLGQREVLFLVLRTFQSVFHSGCTNLYLHQQYVRVPFSSLLCQHLSLSLCLLNNRHSNRGRWHVIVALIYVSLIASNTDDSFQIVVGHLCSYWELFIQVLCLLLNWICFTFIFFWGCWNFWVDDIFWILNSPLEVVYK